jgi:hypothetical protein
MLTFLRNFKAFSVLPLTLTLLLACISKTVNDQPILSIVNPGYDGYPREWTAGKPRDVGSPIFIFYSNETSVGAKFFLNVSVHEVELLIGWGVGLIFDKRVLSYVSAWLPKDHVFQYVNMMGWDIFIPDPYVVSLNETHGAIRWGCTFMPPENETWSFNGTGTLCQIQFKLIKETSAEFWFVFDPEWTALYIYAPNEPDGYLKLTPNLGNAYFKYFGVEPQQNFKDLYLKIEIVIAILVTISFSIFLSWRSLFKSSSKKRRF